MPRPTCLIAEPEPGEALSTRKLVIETAKFNVLTAHSTEEALEILRVCSCIDAAIVHADLPKSGEILSAAKQARSDMHTVYLTPREVRRAKNADFQMSSHDPNKLVEHLRQVFGDPRRLPVVPLRSGPMK